MRETQLKLNRMRKYQMLVNKKQEQQEEAKLEEMRTKLKNDRTQRWKSWVEFMGTQEELYLQMDQRKD
eukprot:9418168-Heterocapsa_arctica.AAC.1